MRKTINCFIPYTEESLTAQIIGALRTCNAVQDIYLLSTHPGSDRSVPSGCRLLQVSSFTSTLAMKQIAQHAYADYTVVYTQALPLTLGYRALERMIDYADGFSGMAYSNYYEQKGGTLRKHPVCDYQTGSVRDDFDFGPLLLFESRSFLTAVHRLSQESETFRYAGLYALRLCLSQQALPKHINEYLYTTNEIDNRLSGEKQFDYVNPCNREVQIEMEKAFTQHLKDIRAWLSPACRPVDLQEGDFQEEASVIIPVRNRARTIDDAIRSSLEQQTDFPFNVIIVDNHSSDGTTEIIDRYREHPQIIHLIPERTDLGIGGCWDMAIRHPRCGRFAIQLDSDDLYSSPHTLSTIVRTFYEQQCPMVIGSYRMTDFQLNTLPPGIIDHREWTENNGKNNALRINGLGAPRAFYTPLLRQCGVPNVSYGEDYALGLTISRRYRIGRIYDELYLCRRWEGNSDAALNVEQVNANNHYKDSLRTLEIEKRKKLNAENEKEEHLSSTDFARFIKKQTTTWQPAQDNHQALAHIQQRHEVVHGAPFTVQWNPARHRSTEARVDAASIQSRPCFLCRENHLEGQGAYALTHHFQLCINPFPILPGHVTLISDAHQPQSLPQDTERHLNDFWKDIPTDYAIFYNGAHCGASAPDHLHFQGAPRQHIPFIAYYQGLPDAEKVMLTYADSSSLFYIQKYPCPVFVIETELPELSATPLFSALLQQLPSSYDNEEPMLNLLNWRQGAKQYMAVFPRAKHRPDCYFRPAAEGGLRVSPGALDMAGIIVTISPEDFQHMTPTNIQSIIQEVGIPRNEAQRIVNYYLNK